MCLCRVYAISLWLLFAFCIRHKIRCRQLYYILYEPKPKSIEQVNAMTIYCCHRHRCRSPNAAHSRETTTRTMVVVVTTEPHIFLRHAILCLLGACRLFLVHLLRFYYYYSCRIFVAAAAASNRPNEWKNVFFFRNSPSLFHYRALEENTRRIRAIVVTVFASFLSTYSFRCVSNFSLVVFLHYTVGGTPSRRTTGNDERRTQSERRMKNEKQKNEEEERNSKTTRYKVEMTSRDEARGRKNEMKNEKVEAKERKKTPSTRRRRSENSRVS